MKTKIIIIDDKVITDKYRKGLEALGVKVFVFNKVEKDITEKVVKIKPDLIAVSTILDGIDGFEIAKKIRSNKLNKSILFALLSTNEEESELIKGEQINAIVRIKKHQVKPKEAVELLVLYQKVGKNQQKINKITNKIIDRVYRKTATEESDNEEYFNDNANNLTEEEFFNTAKEAVISAGRASTSYIQRKLQIGYAHATKLMDELEKKGIVGPANGGKPREVICKLEGDGPEEKGIRVMII